MDRSTLIVIAGLVLGLFGLYKFELWKQARQLAEFLKLKDQKSVDDVLNKIKKEEEEVDRLDNEVKKSREEYEKLK